MSKTLTKAALAEAVYKEIGVSYSESLKMVEMVFETLMIGIKNDGYAKISSFGSFYVLNKKERIGRNPKTKVKAKIKARKVVSFYASNNLKSAMNIVN